MEGVEFRNQFITEANLTLTSALACEVKTVLHIFSGDLWAGAEVMIFSLLNELKNEPGLKIIACSLNEGTLTQKLREVGIETYVIAEAIHSFPGILLKALRLLKGRKIDIIHSHRYKENLLALFLAKFMGVKKLVTTLHGLSEPLLYSQNGGGPIRLKMKMDYFVLRHYFTRAVAVSQEMKKVLVQKYRFSEEKVEIIYNGITLPSVKAPPDSSPHDYFHIGTVGRLVPVKDFHLFLDVAAEIRRQTKKVRFSILGDGPLKEQLIQKAEDLKMQDCVEFLSPLPDPLPYYQSLDLYLNTSLHEGIPLSILEAMACAKPVIAPRVGGIPEIISHGEHGWMVEEHNPEKIALAILNLLNDPDLRLGLGENAFKRVVSCFSSYRMAEAYTQFYQQQ